MAKETIRKALIAIGIDESKIRLTEHKGGSITLRYAYWNWMPEGTLPKLVEKLGDGFSIEQDTYVDDDGEGEGGRTIYRYLHSYIIKRNELEIKNTSTNKSSE